MFNHSRDTATRTPIGLQIFFKRSIFKQAFYGSHTTYDPKISSTSLLHHMVPVTRVWCESERCVIFCVLVWYGITHFFGFGEEFTFPKVDYLDKDCHLCVNHIAVDNSDSPSRLYVLIKKSKTGPFRQGVTLVLGKLGKFSVRWRP